MYATLSFTTLLLVSIIGPSLAYVFVVRPAGSRRSTADLG
jgi:hypothetical protein